LGNPWTTYLDEHVDEEKKGTVPLGSLLLFVSLRLYVASLISCKPHSLRCPKLSGKCPKMADATVPKRRQSIIFTSGAGSVMTRFASYFVAVPMAKWWRESGTRAVS